MAGSVEAILSGIDRRLGELREEEDKLTAARAELLGVNPAAPSSTEGRPAARARPTKARTPRRGRGRPRRGADSRTRQALTLIGENPGITIPQLADKLKIKPNYLYKVIPELVANGQVTKVGRTIHPVAEGAAEGS